VTPDDVQQVARPVLGVRLGTASDATADVLKQIVESVPVPV
jgi:MoxR-like ATPase